MLLAQGFRQVGPSLEMHQRVSVGLKIAQMMIDDRMPDEAVHILQALENDATQLPDEDARKARYFQIQSKCFSELGAYSQAVKAIQQSIQLAPDADSRDRLRAELAELHLLQGRIDEALNPDGASADT
jgi:tetratricopeptide (TPR) repeat protein